MGARPGSWFSLLGRSGLQGADREVARAKELGIEVYTLDEFLQLLEIDNGEG